MQPRKEGMTDNIVLRTILGVKIVTAGGTLSGPDKNHDISIETTRKIVSKIPKEDV